MGKVFDRPTGVNVNSSSSVSNRMIASVDLSVSWFRLFALIMVVVISVVMAAVGSDQR